VARRLQRFEQRRTDMQTKTDHPDLETIDSSQLTSATGGNAKQTVAKIEKGVEKALPAAENFANTIAGLIDG
jgi:hypothetical protein